MAAEKHLQKKGGATECAPEGALTCESATSPIRVAPAAGARVVPRRSQHSKTRELPTTERPQVAAESERQPDRASAPVVHGTVSDETKSPVQSPCDTCLCDPAIAQVPVPGLEPGRAQASASTHLACLKHGGQPAANRIGSSLLCGPDLATLCMSLRPCCRDRLIAR
jgi:hypothetical protein